MPGAHTAASADLAAVAASANRAGASQPLMQGECGSSRPHSAQHPVGADVPPSHYRDDPSKPGVEGRFLCRWQPGDFSAHFYPAACPLHDMIAFMRNATTLGLHWPHTANQWRAGLDAKKRASNSA